MLGCARADASSCGDEQKGATSAMEGFFHRFIAPAA
jgi:hypothetical protein